MKQKVTGVYQFSEAGMEALTAMRDQLLIEARRLNSDPALVALYHRLQAFVQRLRDRAENSETDEDDEWQA